MPEKYITFVESFWLSIRIHLGIFENIVVNKNGEYKWIR